MRPTFLLFAFLLMTTAATAQIKAPRLICVNTLFNGDVYLEWELPINTCGGTFNGYRIYVSTDPTQPFNLLTIVTNPAQTNYTHTGANGNTVTWYYYMTTDMLCPNETPEQSDIVANLPPIVPDLRYVTVLDNGNIEIAWEESVSLETHAYIIFWETNTGFVAIDTVYGRTTTTYEHVGATLSQAVQNYTIVAMDKCGVTGLVNDMPQHSLVLSGEQERCQRTVTLTWNAYDNWANGVSIHQIWLRTNGGTEHLIDNISGAATTYTYGNAQDGDELCFRVYAVENFTNIRSATNVFCINVDNVNPMEQIYLTNVTVNDSNEVELHYRWNDDADIAFFSVSRGNNTDSLSGLSNGNVSFPLQVDNIYKDSTEDATTRPFYYQVFSTDSCVNLVGSNYGASVHLQGIANGDLTNTITWSAYDNQYGFPMEYSLYRIVDGVEELVKTFNILERKYLDQVDGRNESEVNIYYYVIARAEMTYPDGTFETVYSRSNTVCVQQFTSAIAPNAFVPNGQNNIFKPVVVFGESADYYMSIYDRWGGMVYETRNLNDGWNGMKNGKPARQGVYAYYIRLTQPNGTIRESKGTVLLIR